MDNHGSSRPRNVSGGGGHVGRSGSGLGTGPVGRGGGIGAGKNSGRSFSPFGSSGGGSSGGGGSFFGGGGFRRGGNNGCGGCGCGSIAVIAIVLVLILVIFGVANTFSCVTNIFKNFEIPSSVYSTVNNQSNNLWFSSANTTSLNTSVADGSRDKYTKIAGGGKDIVTVMIYMCGSDLETECGSATKDIQEMANADISNNVNVILFTGGAKKWNNNTIKSGVNQIYRVVNGGLISLKEDAGHGSMTDPDTLLSFLQYAKSNYAANRYDLIFWDHGSGSVEGYGYDETSYDEDSMTLPEINNALAASGMKYDFVGFDACLMASVENALMLSNHADYLIASEETEPSTGWYYTNWLSSLSANTSTDTLTIAKEIIDDYTKVSAQSSSGSSTTLSLTDLAEAEHTIPPLFKNFSSSISNLIDNDSYKQIATVRKNSREFGSSYKTDQVDLSHFALTLNNNEGKALSEAIINAVKYNSTSYNMTNSYGLSIYFPYKNLSYVDNAVDAYEQIGIDESYSKCIKSFAALTSAGQISFGGIDFPWFFSGRSASDYKKPSQNDILSILKNFTAGARDNTGKIDTDNIEYLNDIDVSKYSKYLSSNSFDASKLVWSEDDDGFYLVLEDKQWELINALALNMYVDDGGGFIDLGVDNFFEFDDNGWLRPLTDGSWLALDGHTVAFYYESSGNGITTGYIPAFVNDIRSEIVVSISETTGEPVISGLRRVYDEGETNTVSKELSPLEAGDKIEPVYDYYNYKGDYEDTYRSTDTFTYTSSSALTYIYLEEKVYVTYRFTDIYNNDYWTDSLFYDLSK